MTILKQGDKGQMVTELQNLLYAAGQHVDRDGDFGKMTEQGVKNFQRQHGLMVDGVAGPQTMAALRSMSESGIVSDAGAQAMSGGVTAAQLRQIMPQAGANTDKFAGSLNAAMQKYQINTPARIAAFLAQIGHESGQLSRVVENLNYSAERLAAVWPNRYRSGGKPNALAMQIARNPQAIANHTYANRMGNGSVESGDGWKYRGRGLIQVTGRGNYATYSSSLNLPLIERPELLEQPEHAAMSAAAYWAKNSLNRLADAGDMRYITKIINGSYNGLSDRLALWERAKKVLKC